MLSTSAYNKRAKIPQTSMSDWSEQKWALLIWATQQLHSNTMTSCWRLLYEQIPLPFSSSFCIKKKFERAQLIIIATHSLTRNRFSQTKPKVTYIYLCQHCKCSTRVSGWQKEKGSNGIYCVSYTGCYTSHPVYQCILPGNFLKVFFQVS